MKKKRYGGGAVGRAYAGGGEQEPVAVMGGYEDLPRQGTSFWRCVECLGQAIDFARRGRDDESGEHFCISLIC